MMLARFASLFVATLAVACKPAGLPAEPAGHDAADPDAGESVASPLSDPFTRSAFAGQKLQTQDHSHHHHGHGAKKAPADAEAARPEGKGK